jgi:hypothetical protein
MYIYDAKNNEWIPLRSTRQYKNRKRKLRDIWILVGMLMISVPLPIILVITLFFTFMSFAYLDESSYVEKLISENNPDVETIAQHQDEEHSDKS